MEVVLLFAALVIIACILFNKLSDHIGVPALLAFILLGMVCGVDGIFHIDFDNFPAAENAATVALIFIMFYGGFGTNWAAARRVAGRAVILIERGSEVIIPKGNTTLRRGDKLVLYRAEDARRTESLFPAKKE